jgi:drug/metabolite transporter (DMT)-like permease
MDVLSPYLPRRGPGPSREERRAWDFRHLPNLLFVHYNDLKAGLLTPWQPLLGLGLLLPLTLVFEGRLGAEWNPTSIGVIVYNGPIATAFCYWAATTISRALPAITTSLSFLGVPAVGILCSLLFLGERPDAALLGGFGLIFVGVTLVNLADR